MQGIEHPVPISQISKFELQNTEIAINVLAWGEEVKEIIPLYCTKYRGRKYIINLFLIQELVNEDDGEFLDTSNVKKHYTLVRNLSRLLSKFSKYRGKFQLYEIWQDKTTFRRELIQV